MIQVEEGRRGIIPGVQRNLRARASECSSWQLLRCIFTYRANTLTVFQLGSVEEESEGEEEMDDDMDMDMDMDLESEEDQGDSKPSQPIASSSKSKPKPKAGNASKNPYPLEGKYIDEDDREQ